MTGYAAASAGSLNLELRTVNARFLDVQFRIADELRALEPLLREQIAARVARGKVDCRFYRTEEIGTAAPKLNPQALERLKKLSDAAKQAFPDAAPLRIADVLRWPGVIAEEADEESLRAAATEVCRRALQELVAARTREGAKLAAAIVERVRRMREQVEMISPLLPEAIAAYQERVRRMREQVEMISPLLPEAIAAYQERIAERLREAIGTADDERIRAEIAIFGTKVDVAEELDRLRAHLDEVQNILAKGGAIGKRLDFIAQELNREANTLAAKAASAAISDRALELKLLIEQVREQVQNIE